nr:hypothetical protein CFP56_40369 [Quercus suber]
MKSGRLHSGPVYKDNLTLKVEEKAGNLVDKASNAAQSTKESCQEVILQKKRKSRQEYGEINQYGQGLKDQGEQIYVDDDDIQEITYPSMLPPSFIGKGKGEEPLGFGNASTTGVAVPGSEATAGGAARVVARGANVEVRLGESLLPLQDLWRCSTSLFPLVGALERKELLLAPIQFLCPCGTTVGWSIWVEQEVVDEGLCQILRDAMNFKAVVLSRVWNIYKDVKALHFLVCHWNPDAHTFFFPWGETMVTLEDMERICLLPSMGDMDPLELRLSDEEFVIAGKLLETFTGTLYFELDRLRSDELEGLPYHIIKSSINVVLLQTFIWEHSTDYVDVDGLPLLMKWMGLKVWNLPTIILLDDGAHFAWKPYSYVAAGYCCPNPFPNAKPRSQEFGLNDHEKIPNFLLITSPSHIPYPSGEGYDLEYAPADFGKLLFLASVSSRVSSPNVRCSLGPTDEDIEMAGESPTTNITGRENITEMLGQGLASEDPEVTVSGEAIAGKGPNVTVTAGEVVAGVPS